MAKRLRLCDRLTVEPRGPRPASSPERDGQQESDAIFPAIPQRGDDGLAQQHEERFMNILERIGRWVLTYIAEMGRMLIFVVSSFAWLFRPPLRFVQIVKQLHF